MSDDQQPVADSPDAPSGETSAPAPKKRWSKPLTTVTALLCLVLGVAIVAQVRQVQGDELAALSQNELIRLLEEVSVMNEDLENEVNDLLVDRANLISGADTEKYNESYFWDQSILAGTVPVDGTGIILTVDDPLQGLTSYHFVHVMEELRNAGAEAIEVSGIRLTANSYFLDTTDGLVLDGVPISSPYEWRAIGPVETMRDALRMHGGAVVTMTQRGAQVDLQDRELVQVTAIKDPPSPKYAHPLE